MYSIFALLSFRAVSCYNGAYQFELVLVVANAMLCDFVVSFIRDCLNSQIKRCHWHIRWMKCIYIKWQYQDVTWGIHRDRTLMLNDIFYHDMQISWPDPGSPAIWFLTRSVPKPRLVLAPTARCVTCTLPVLTLVTCNTKMCRFKINFSLWNFYIGYFHRFHRIIFFCIFTILTIQRHAVTSKTFGKAEWMEDICRRARCACQLIMTSLTKRFKAPQILSIAELGKSVITDVNPTFGDIHHCKIPLLICNWIFTYS